MFTKCAKTSSTPGVQWTSGLISIRDELFADPLAEAVQRFVGRAFAVEPIDAIEIDHSRRVAVLRFDAATPVEVILSRVATAVATASRIEENTKLHQLLTRGPARGSTRIYRCGDSFSAWKLTPLTDGKVRLSHEVVTRHEEITLKVCRKLETLPGVAAVRRPWFSRSLVVEPDSAPLNYDQLLEAADDQVHTLPSESTRSLMDHPLIYPITHLSRGVYLFLGGVSFIMSIVGLLVPGIPTVPFVLLTSYFLTRSSPALNERLLRSRLFGPMVRDWQRHRGMRRSVKLTLLGIMAVLVSISVFVVGVQGPTLIVVVVMSIVSLYLIVKIPTVTSSETEDTESAAVLPASPALLPAPG